MIVPWYPYCWYAYRGNSSITHELEIGWANNNSTCRTFHHRRRLVGVGLPASHATPNLRECPRPRSRRHQAHAVAAVRNSWCRCRHRFGSGRNSASNNANTLRYTRRSMPGDATSFATSVAAVRVAPHGGGAQFAPTTKECASRSQILRRPAEMTAPPAHRTCPRHRNANVQGRRPNRRTAQGLWPRRRPSAQGVHPSHRRGATTHRRACACYCVFRVACVFFGGTFVPACAHEPPPLLRRGRARRAGGRACCGLRPRRRLPMMRLALGGAQAGGLAPPRDPLRVGAQSGAFSRPTAVTRVETSHAGPMMQAIQIDGLQIKA